MAETDIIVYSSFQIAPQTTTLKRPDTRVKPNTRKNLCKSVKILTRTFGQRKAKRLTETGIRLSPVENPICFKSLALQQGMLAATSLSL